MFDAQDTLKKLSFIKGVQVIDWPLIRKLVKSIADGTSVVQSKKFFDPYREKYGKTDLKEMDVWSTFQDCHYLEFFYSNDKLLANATIYDGDNFRGHRTSRRFTAQIHVPLSFLEDIARSVDSYFIDQLREEYQQSLIEKEERWIANRAKKLLEAKE